MYSPLNAVSSSQTGVIAVPDSPDRRTAAHKNNESTSGNHEVYKAKSESPELSASVLEFPSSSAPSRTNDTAIQTQSLDDPIIISSLANSSDPHRSNAGVPAKQISATAPSSDLQERAVPTEVLRRSPFLNHFSSQVVPREKALNFSGLRQRTPNHADSVESEAVRAQAPLDYESKERPAPACSPIKVRVSGKVVSSLQPGGPITGATYGESLLPGIQRELSFGPEILIGSGTRSPVSSEQQSPTDHHLIVEEVPSEASLSEVVEHQATPELGDDICTSTQSADEDVITKGSKSDRVCSPEHVGPVAVDQQSADEEAYNESGAPKADEQRSMSLMAGLPNFPSVPMRVLQLRESTEDNRGGTPSSQESVVSQVRDQLNPGYKTRSAPRNGAEIISIEETEAEASAIQPRPMNEKVVQKPDIWAIPSDTDEKLKFKSNGKRNHTPSWGVTPRKSVDRKIARSHTEERQRESIQSVKEKPTDLEIVAEKERQEREKKDKAKARRKERAAEKKAEEAKWAEGLKANDAKPPKNDQEQRESSKLAVVQRNAVAKNTTRGKTPSTNTAGDSEVKKAKSAKSTGVATSEGHVDKRKKTSTDTVPSLDKERKAKDAAKRAVPDGEASEAHKAKQAKVSMVKESQQLWAERKAIQEAEMAAREAEAIAQAQRSVKVPSKKPATLKAGQTIAETGLTSETERNFQDPSRVSRRTSATPSNRHDAAPKRRSMTPLFPSTTMKPVKSALRSSEISVRRSVSFNDEAVALNSPTLMTAQAARPPRNSDILTNAQAAAKKGDSQQLEPHSSPSDRASKKRESDVSARPKLRGPSSSKSATPSTDAISKSKVQTKLNVTRDVKLKGRETDAPRLPKPVTLAENEEIIISSDSERSASTFYSDEEDRTRPAKAGPSSKKKLSSSTNLDGGITPRRATTSRSNSGSTNNIVHKEENVSPVTAISNKAASDRDPREMSTTRSPAQYMSRASSAHSLSGSSIGSRTVSEDGSESEIESQNGSESDSGSDDDTQASDELPSAPRHKAGSDRNSIQPSHSKDSDIQKPDKSPQSRAASAEDSVTSSESGSEEEEAEDLANLMERQLQRDCRQTTEPPQSRKQPALPLAKPAARKAAPAQPAAVEPSNARFPSLSGLRSRAPKNTANTAAARGPASIAISNGTKHGATQSSQIRSQTSMSESDESSSSSDDSDEISLASQQHQDAKRPSSTMKNIGRIIRRTFMF